MAPSYRYEEDGVQLLDPVVQLHALHHAEAESDVSLLGSAWDSRKWARREARTLYKSQVDLRGRYRHRVGDQLLVAVPSGFDRLSSIVILPVTPELHAWLNPASRYAQYERYE